MTYNGNPKNLNKLGRSLVFNELGASTDAPNLSNVGDPQSFSDINRPGINETCFPTKERTHPRSASLL